MLALQQFAHQDLDGLLALDFPGVDVAVEVDRDRIFCGRGEAPGQERSAALRLLRSAFGTIGLQGRVALR